jgi:hypothetical protein
VKVRILGIVVPFIPLFLVCCLSSIARAQDPQGPSLHAAFRPGHNLTFLGVLEQTRWHVRDTENISGLDGQVWTPGALLRYSFHINIYGDTGFAVGTGLSAYFHNRNIAGGSGEPAPEFRPGLGIQFPSLALGIVHNFGSDYRASLFAEYAALYFGQFKVTTRGKEIEGAGADQPQRTQPERLGITIIPDSWVFSLQAEAFVLPTLAVAALVGYRTVQSSCLGGCSASAFVNSVRFLTEGYQIGLGVSWQAGLFFDE